MDKPVPVYTAAEAMAALSEPERDSRIAAGQAAGKVIDLRPQLWARTTRVPIIGTVK